MSVDLARSHPSRGAKSKRRFRRARKIVLGVRDNIRELPKKIPIVNAVIQKRNIKADYYDQEKQARLLAQKIQGSLPQKQHQSENTQNIQTSGQQKHHQSKKAQNVQRSEKKDSRQHHSKQTSVQNVPVQQSGQEQQSIKPHDNVQRSEQQQGAEINRSGRAQISSTGEANSKIVGVVGGSSRSGGQQSRLSPVPIIEFLGNEDASPSCPSVPPLLYYRSNSDSQLIFSRSDITRRDGPGGQNSMSLTAYSSVPSLIEYSKANLRARAEEPVNRLDREEPFLSGNAMESAMNTLSEATVVYTKQTILGQLNPDYLTVGEDGYYYETRDYSINETDFLGSGGFGVVRWAQDQTTGMMFAIKQNKKDELERFKSIEDECRILSCLAENNHIVKFLGAVIDEVTTEQSTQPLRLCKMMMELAESIAFPAYGNLAEMLRDEYGEEAPLPQDQSLYYLQQILERVNFLHQSGYLHLDIKTRNILMFDGGRIVKLCDFDSAVVASEARGHRRGFTPYFAAPEVLRGEVARFSADIWSTLCVLVEMLTARMPFCYQEMVKNMEAVFFEIGNYEDDRINDLIPLYELDIEPEVKQLFIDVFRKDPQSRPLAHELLDRPIISSAVEYIRYFDEIFDELEDAEDLEAPPTTNFEDSLPITDMQQQTSLISPTSPTTSLHSMVQEEKIGDLSSELSLIITNAEQYLSWPEFGLSLHVPENSLPEGIEQCSVSIKTRTLGDYKFPKDSHLVSAVYSIKCVPKCRFSEPVTLEIQHCAKPKNTHKLSFVRAIRSDSKEKTSLFHAVETGETPEMDGILYSCFPCNASYGCIELSKFCQFGVIQRDTDERDYCVNVYYQENDAKKFGVYFTILWNTSTHKKVLDEHYQKKNAVCQHDQPVEFEDNQIKLDIPFPSSKGIVSDDNAWRILSLTPPVIAKKEVDSFKEGKRIPSCQLMVKCDSEQVTDLELQPVNLKGAREPYNIFTINIIAANSKCFAKSEERFRHQQSHTDASESAHTTQPSLAEILPELQVITKPLQLGIFLDIKYHILEEFRKDHREVSEQRTAVIEYWHRNCTECSWRALADAVDKMGNHSKLVKKLQELDDLQKSKTSNIRASKSEQACIASEPPVVGPQHDKLSGSQSSIKGQYNKSSSEISFNLLIRELSSKVSTDWEDIGLFLELEQGALDEIRSKSSSHTKKCFREMIKLWLRQDDPPPCWSAIIDAIEELDYESLAQELKDKFL